MEQRLSGGASGVVSSAAAAPTMKHAGGGAGGGGGGVSSKAPPVYSSVAAVGSPSVHQRNGCASASATAASLGIAENVAHGKPSAFKSAANAVYNSAAVSASDDEGRCGADAAAGEGAARNAEAVQRICGSVEEGAVPYDAEEEEDMSCTYNGDAVPVWQREAQLQPLVGPKESLTALLRDFEGSELQYAKARTFLVRLRGQQRQRESVNGGGRCSKAGGPVATKAGCCCCSKSESGSITNNTLSSTSSINSSHYCSTVSSAGSGVSDSSSSCTPDHSHPLSSSGRDGSAEGRQGGHIGQKSGGDCSKCGGRQRSEAHNKNVSVIATARDETQCENKKGVDERGACGHGEDEGDDDSAEEEGGPCMRRVRGDGCCFYRGYMFGLLLYFLRHRDKIKGFIKRINEEFRHDIRKVGYDMDTVADFYQEMIDSLELVEAASAKDPTSEEVVEEIFNEVSSSNYIVVFARLLVSTHMKLNTELYSPFLTSYATVEEFCKHEVDPMWVAAEELQINALTAMTQVPVEIIYFDRSPGVNPTHHVFPESQTPQIHLLYRPGHYDILST